MSASSDKRKSCWEGEPSGKFGLKLQPAAEAIAHFLACGRSLPEALEWTFERRTDSIVCKWLLGQAAYFGVN